MEPLHLHLFRSGEEGHLDWGFYAFWAGYGVLAGGSYAALATVLLG
jgi:hypothetical protein